MDINLLPWREEILSINKKIVLRLTLFSVAVAVILLILMHQTFFNQVGYTKQYIQALENAQTQLMSRVKGYLGYKTLQQKIDERSNNLNQLLNSRYDTVRLLNEISSIIPKGIYLTFLKRTNNVVELKGTASSNLLISKLMQSIEPSSNLKTVSLQKVEKTKDQGFVVTQFDLQLSFTTSAINVEKEKNTGKEEKSELNNPVTTIQKKQEEQKERVSDLLEIKR